MLYNTITYAPTAPVEKYTVLFTDGMLILDELSTDRVANMAEHGDVVAVYTPSPYAFTSATDRPWDGKKRDIKSVKLGSPIETESLAYWFNNMSNLTSVDLTGIDSTNCTTMNRMCSSATKLATLTGLDTLVTDKVTDMMMMFYNCFLLPTIDVSSFDTAKVTTMNQMFRGCSRLATIYASDKFVTSAVTNGNNMFTDDTVLVGGNGTAYDSSHITHDYAKIDKAGSPGYFTEKG